VPVGSTCVDRYEASVWQVPASNDGIVKLLQRGRVTLDDLRRAGATQLGVAAQANCTGNEYGAGFPVTGNWTTPVYAASVAGVTPSGCVSWFQAEQACRLARKRLPTNQEWQAAAAGTPDGAPCKIAESGPASTGTAGQAAPAGTPDGAPCKIAESGPASTGTAGCVSSWGAFDMVGNMLEWTAEWIPFGSNTTQWPAAFGSDESAIGGPPLGPAANLPSVLMRGGHWDGGVNDGVFALESQLPQTQGFTFGFRCAR
jgi:formylglycine-generating enzyme required for sulfatase activity